MYQLNNLFYGELDLSGGDITSGASTITLSSGDVANLEITPTATDPAIFMIWDKAYETGGAARRAGGKVELFLGTGKDEGADTLTAGTRGFSNTTAQSYNGTDDTTYGIVQVSADELFDALLIVNSSSQIVDRSGTVLNAPMFSGMSDDNVDINGGAIDGTPIGQTSKSPGKFSVLNSIEGRNSIPVGTWENLFEVPFDSAWLVIAGWDEVSVTDVGAASLIVTRSPSSNSNNPVGFTLGDTGNIDLRINGAYVQGTVLSGSGAPNVKWAAIRLFA